MKGFHYRKQNETHKISKHWQFCIRHMASTKKLSTSAATSGRLDLIDAVGVVHDNL